jgi:hypothetical protein
MFLFCFVKAACTFSSTNTLVSLPGVEKNVVFFAYIYKFLGCFYLPTFREKILKR